MKANIFLIGDPILRRKIRINVRIPNGKRNFFLKQCPPPFGLFVLGEGGMKVTRY